MSISVPGAAVICYQCNSEYDPRCGDPFDPYSLGTVNCSFQPRLEHLNHLEPTLCRKITQKGQLIFFFSACFFLCGENPLSLKLYSVTSIFNLGLPIYKSNSQRLCTIGTSRIQSANITPYSRGVEPGHSLLHSADVEKQMRLWTLSGRRHAGGIFAF